MKKGFLPFSTLLAATVLAVFFASSTTPVERLEYHAGHVPFYAAEAYLSSLRANQHTGTIDPADEIGARQSAMQLKAGDGQDALNWVTVGPDNFGGKVTSILYDNRDAAANTIIASTMGGGLWKSTNNGITWSSIGNESFQASAMAQSDNGTIFVGTGDGLSGLVTNYNILGFWNFNTSFMGTGMYKVTGNEITHLPATIPTFNDTGSDWAFIFDVETVGEDGVLAATNSGLKFSPDAGGTWFVATDVEDNELMGRATAIKRASDGTLVAAVGTNLYISKSGDPLEFVNRSTGDSVSLPTLNVFKIEIAIAPSDPNVMYAALINQGGTHTAIYATFDKGDTWEVIMPATTVYNIFGGRGVSNSFVKVFPENPYRLIVGGLNLWQGRRVVPNGYYAWEMKSRSFTFEFDPSYLHAGQQALAFRPGTNNRFIAGTDGGVFKAEVSGENYTYSTSNRNFINTQFYTVFPGGRDNNVLGGAQSHGIIHISGGGNTVRQGKELWFQGGSFVNGHGTATAISTINPEAIIMGAPGGQIFRSEDLAFTTSAQFLKDTNYMRTSQNVLAGSNAFKIPISYWESFTNENSRDSITFHAKRNYSSGEVIKVRSNNNDHPFLFTMPTSLATGDSIRIKDIVSSKLFIAAQNRLWMTTEVLNFAKFPNWYVVTNNTTGLTGMPQSIAHSSDANHVFVGMMNGRFYRVSNLALAYNFSTADIRGSNYNITTTEIPIFLPGTTIQDNRPITSIAVDPSNANNVIVTYGMYGNDHYVYMSNNALSAEPTFVSKQGNLPKMPVYASLFEMSNTGKAMVGTDLGVFVTNNINASTPSWAPDRGIMGTVPVFDLKQQTLSKTFDTLQLINVDTLVLFFPGVYNYGVIYAATFGRGIMRSNDYQLPVSLEEKPVLAQSTKLNFNIYPNPMTTQSTIAYELGEMDVVDYHVYDLSGRIVLSGTLGKQMAGKHSFVLDRTGLNAGTYIIHLRAGSMNGTSKLLVY